MRLPLTGKACEKESQAAVSVAVGALQLDGRGMRLTEDTFQFLDHPCCGYFLAVFF